MGAINDLSPAIRLLFRGAALLWASPNTSIGLALGLILGGRFQVVDGVVEVHGPRIAYVLERMWVPAAAITLGHCVLAQSAPLLHQTRRHERVHVRQYECWGPLFIPTYLLLSAGLALCGRDGYRENPFEVAAFRVPDDC